MFLTEIKNVGKPDVEIDVKYSERDRTVRYRLLAISALSYTEKHLIEKNIYMKMILVIQTKVLISVKNMNLLSSSIYKHLKTNLIKYKQSLILWECGSQLISVLSNIFQF
jgi:hypothetical protein